MRGLEAAIMSWFGLFRIRSLSKMTEEFGTKFSNSGFEWKWLLNVSWGQFDHLEDFEDLATTLTDFEGRRGALSRL